MINFRSIHAHGFVRVGACTPIATVGCPHTNMKLTEDLANQAAGEYADLLVFPELNISSYSIDDLHLQDTIIKSSLQAIVSLAERSKSLRPVLIVGAALERNGRLYNCAVVIKRGVILGVVPKTFLPNYREYHEKRYFASGMNLKGLTIKIGDQEVPFGTDLVFCGDGIEGFSFAAEICEDFWAPTPPSTTTALAGAHILCNLSASPITIGKSRERALLCASHSARTVSAYVYTSAGPGESSTDLSWDGQSMIYELGEELAQSERFRDHGDILWADIDVQRLRLERLRMGTFNDSAVAAGHPEQSVRTIHFKHKPADEDICFKRNVSRFPFVPNDPQLLNEDCYEAFNIQVEALKKRILSTNTKKIIIGVSGGLDSTHALIVAAKAMDRLGRPRTDIMGFTLPGFATGDTTKGNAWKLMTSLGITAEEIDIKPAAERMLKDIGHPYADGKPVYDVTFENVQAGLRTDYLFRLANQNGGFVLGTGDLSELALGWCTYGVGDHMSHYGINAGVPKTLIQHLIRWIIETKQFDFDTGATLYSILGTEISPELVPADADGAIQSTQDMIGPYELHDFFLHYVVRKGMGPTKIAFLAWKAWGKLEAGEWPVGFPEAQRNEYSLATIRKWLEAFITRFFETSQFKRSCVPGGPKVSAGGALSPRGDWRAPSDGVADAWRKELTVGLSTMRVNDA